MAEYVRRFRCQVITPEKQLGPFEAVSVIFPAADGQVGVLNDRAPLIALLGAGPLRIRSIDGRLTEYFVSGGFAQVRQNVTTILTEQCVPLSELDAAAAQKELDEAQAMSAGSPEAVALRAAAAASAKTKLRLAREQGKE